MNPAITERLKTWMVDEVLPFWADTGIERQSGAFHERLTEAGTPDLSVPRRVRVQARQIYVYAHAAVLGLYPGGASVALRAFDRLMATAHAPDGRSGFVHLLHPDGSVANPLRDSYDHAFIVLACAWLARATGEPRVRQVLDGTLDYIARDLTASDGTLYEGDPRTLPRRQNPQMHWFEAALALDEALGHPAARRLARRSFEHLESHLYDPATETIGEYFDDEWRPMPGQEGQVIEPGHLAEWVWLLRKAEGVLGRSTADLSGRLLTRALRFQDERLGLLVDEATRDGRITRPTRRSWLQTELAKAHLAQADRGDPAASLQASAALENLEAHYLGKPFRAGWIDQLDEAGTPLPAPVSASTFYHIFVAICEADRVIGKN